MTKSDLKQTFFTPFILSKSTGHRIAYVALLTAFSVVANMYLEFKMSDVQFSVTIVISVIIGVLVGPVLGFAACFTGDLIGFMLNSWGMLYMPWVGLSTAFTAFIAGLIMNNVKWKFKGAMFVKLAIVCVLSLMLCTIGINSTGFYYYNKAMGFSTAVVEYVSQKFGTGVSYWGYVAYRLLFRGQIWNSLANYALLFILIPILNKTKSLKMNIS